MVLLTPVLGLAPALELHRLDVGAGDDEVVLDEPHGVARAILIDPGAEAGRADLNGPFSKLWCAT